MVTTRFDTSDALGEVAGEGALDRSTPNSGAATRSTNARLTGAGQPQSNRTCQ